MKKLMLALACVFAGSFFVSPVTSAAGLKLAPLEYRTTLKQGEKQKGFVDVSNPAKETIRVKTSAQAFRQIDDNGSLQFFDNEQVTAGVLLDLDEFELGPHEAVRMYFQLDSTRLPDGDVFAAIFFTTTPATKPNGVGQAVKLGTLLSIVNGTPGARDAEVKSLSTSFIQFSDTIRGSYAIKNTGDPAKTTGFYPVVQLQASPLGEAKKQTGRLTFAGITRTNEFSLKVFPLGIYQVSAGYMGSKQSSWVIVASPVAIIALVVAGFLSIAAWRYARKRRARIAIDSSSKSLRK